MDKQQLIRALRDTAQAASNSVAEGFTGPVELIAEGLRRSGLNVGDPIGGSKWMADQGMTVPVEEGVPKVIGDTVGLVIPAMAASKYSNAARGLMEVK